MNNIKLKRLELARIVIRIVTTVAFAGLVPLAIFTPWSSERIVEDYITYGRVYTVYHYDIYLALVYALPVIGLLAANGSVKRYLKRLRNTTASTIRVSPTQTVVITQTNSKSQQQQQIRSIKLNHCVICGQPNDYDSKFCKYCGNQL